MTKEEKNLLLKDLCARLPYDVAINCKNDDSNYICYLTTDIINELKYNREYYEYKPYLFPLSSMTEEQKKEISKRYNLHTSYGFCIEITNHSEGYWDDNNSCHLQDYLWLIDWLNKNHFDYRGLIEKGLAIDATNLNIY